MSDTKFTPGPWTVSKICTTSQGGRPIASEDKRVAVADLQTEVKRSDAWRAKCEERDANAHLIAAAPDLYAALEHARPFLNAHGADTDYIDAALAKARGEA